MKFNPLVHWENLKLLEEADPCIKADINQLKEMIDNDLVEITDKHYYKKKYEELVKNKSPFAKLLNQNIKSRNITRITTTGTSNTRGKSTSPFSNKSKKTINTELKKLNYPKKEECKY